MSESPRLRIHWAGAKTTPGTWYLGLFGRYERKAGGGRRRRGWAISVRGLLCWSAVAAVCGYFLGAAYVWQKQATRPHNEVTYTDVLLFPLRKDEIRLKRGRALIAEGRDAIRAGDSRTGFMLLRSGLQRNPDDLEARLLVARFFLSARVRNHAHTFLMEGLDLGWPGRDYLETAHGIIASSEDHELMITFCDRALALHDPEKHPAEDRLWLLLNRLNATFDAEQYEAVFTFLDTHESEFEPSIVREKRLLALLGQGRSEEAVAFVEQWRASAGETQTVMRLAVRTYRETKLLDKMDDALATLIAQTPTDPRVHAFSIIQNLLAGRDTDSLAAIDNYIFRFGGTPQNLTSIAVALGQIGRVEELDLVITALEERGVRDARIGAVRLIALIDEHRFQEALEQVRALRTMTTPGDSSAIDANLDYNEALLIALLDPARGAQSSFVDKIRPLQLTLPFYRNAIALLRLRGRVDTARQIVTFAEGVFPGNASLAGLRAELDAEIAAAAPADDPADNTINETLATSPAFFAALSAYREAGNTAAGLALIRDVRRESPVWLAAEQQAVSRAEIGLLARGDDLVALQGAARVYLNGDLARSQIITALATDLHQDGLPEKSLLLLNEVLRRTPNYERARLTRDAFFPPPPPDPPTTPTPDPGDDAAKTL